MSRPALPAPAVRQALEGAVILTALLAVLAAGTACFVKLVFG